MPRETNAKVKAKVKAKPTPTGKKKPRRRKRATASTTSRSSASQRVQVIVGAAQPRSHPRPRPRRKRRTARAVPPLRGVDAFHRLQFQNLVAAGAGHGLLRAAVPPPPYPEAADAAQAAVVAGQRRTAAASVVAPKYEPRGVLSRLRGVLTPARKPPKKPKRTDAQPPSARTSDRATRAFDSSLGGGAALPLANDGNDAALSARLRSWFTPPSRQGAATPRTLSYSAVSPGSDEYVLDGVYASPEPPEPRQWRRGFTLRGKKKPLSSVPEDRGYGIGAGLPVGRA